MMWQKWLPVPWWTRKVKQAIMENEVLLTHINGYQFQTEWFVTASWILGKDCVYEKVQSGDIFCAITRSPPAVEVWRQVQTICGLLVYKPSTALEHAGRLVYKEDKIVDIWAAHYATVSSRDRYRDPGEKTTKANRCRLWERCKQVLQSPDYNEGIKRRYKHC